MLWMILFYICSFSSALTIYDNAKYEPNNIYFMLDNITQVYSQMDCACLCFANAKCLTATYFGTTQYCILYLTTLNQCTISIMTTNKMASVLTFKDKTLPAPSVLTDTNETVYAIWNTTAGHDSYPSLAGNSSGDYYPGQGPAQAFDGNFSTKYVNFGTCNSIVGAVTYNCGYNTGLFLSPQRGISLLLGFTFCTANSYSQRDPILVTVEGSNQPSTALTNGSSWTLIYNGSSGLDTDPGRLICGVTQWLSNNFIWYTSYRILVLTKRSYGNFVQYSELQLLSY